MCNKCFSKIMPFMTQCGKNTVEPEKPQTTIWRMRIACWIPKATKTLSGISNTYCFSIAVMVARTRLNVTL